MDLLRAVLGDKKLNYLGYSYGAFLGATYAQLYPERVGHLVLDGAIDAVSNLDVSTTQAIGFESALRAYMADCLKGKKCPFRAPSTRRWRPRPCWRASTALRRRTPTGACWARTR
jgi:pimeloyl-ACP methyl ester carboxylesterase